MKRTVPFIIRFGPTRRSRCVRSGDLRRLVVARDRFVRALTGCILSDMPALDLQRQQYGIPVFPSIQVQQVTTRDAV